MVVMEELQILQTLLRQEVVVAVVVFIIQVQLVFLTDQEELMLLVVELVDTLIQQGVLQELREQLIQVVVVVELVLNFQVLQEV